MRAASQGRSRKTKSERIRTTTAIAKIAATTFFRSFPGVLALNMHFNMRLSAGTANAAMVSFDQLKGEPPFALRYA
jgi:hypothetical protein